MFNLKYLYHSPYIKVSLALHVIVDGRVFRLRLIRFEEKKFVKIYSVSIQ